MKILKITFFIILVFGSNLFSQYQKNEIALSVNVNYITTARLFLNPDSDNIELQNRSSDIEDIFSYSADLRYALTDHIIFGFNIERMNKTESLPNLIVNTPSGLRSIFVNDGFEVIPVELSIYYFLPFSTEKFKFMMGGGIGYYYGKFIRSLNKDLISSESKEFAYGIQVSTSMDYLVNQFISIRTEMKFRDPQFTSTNIYNEKIIDYEGNQIRIINDNFKTKVNIDGATFSLGAVFRFNSIFKNLLHL